MAVASGARVSLVFGQADKTVNGKKTKVNLIASVSQSIIDALGIKFKKAGTAAPKLVVDAKKRKRLPTVTGTRSGRRKLLASEDGITFYSIIVPTGMGYGVAADALGKNSKAKVFKTPSGTRLQTGEVKASTAKKPTAKPSRRTGGRPRR